MLALSLHPWTANACLFCKIILWLCSPAEKQGYAIHVYAASESMRSSSFCNADGDFLIVPQQGADSAACLPASVHHDHLAFSRCRGQQHSLQGSLASTFDMHQVHSGSHRQQRADGWHCWQARCGCGRSLESWRWRRARSAESSAACASQSPCWLAAPGATCWRSSAATSRFQTLVLSVRSMEASLRRQQMPVDVVQCSPVLLRCHAPRPVAYVWLRRQSFWLAEAASEPVRSCDAACITSSCFAGERACDWPGPCSLG